MARRAQVSPLLSDLFLFHFELGGSRSLAEVSRELPEGRVDLHISTQLLFFSCQCIFVRLVNKLFLTKLEQLAKQ